MRCLSRVAEASPDRCSRSLPNIIVCGTPGTGKSTHATDLVARCPHELQHVEVGKLVKTLGLHHGFDEHWQTYDVDEDRVRRFGFRER